MAKAKKKISLYRSVKAVILEGDFNDTWILKIEDRGLDVLAPCGNEVFITFDEAVALHKAFGEILKEKKKL